MPVLHCYPVIFLICNSGNKNIIIRKRKRLPHGKQPPINSPNPPKNSQPGKQRWNMLKSRSLPQKAFFIFLYLSTTTTTTEKKNQLGNFNKTTQLTDLQVAGLNSSKIPENTNMQVGLLSKREFLQPNFRSCSHLSLFHRRKKGEGGRRFEDISPFTKYCSKCIFNMIYLHLLG